MRLLAVDLGGSHVTCAFVEAEGVRASRRLRAAAGGSLAALLPEIAEALRAVATEADVPITSCAGLGFGFPGLVDADRGRVLSTNAKYDDAPALDLAAWAAAELDLPLRLENDARLALLGERLAGAARGCDDIVMMTLGTGIGGCAMMQGRLVRGRHHQAGVLGGHLPVRFDGRRCTCGNLGCADAEASSWALPRVCRAWPGFESSVLARQGVTLDYETVFSAAASGDRVARAVRDRSLAVWSAAAVALIHAYDPEVLVLGGGVMCSGSVVLPHVEDHVHRHAWTPWGTVRVLRGALEERAALFGALALFS